MRDFKSMKRQRGRNRSGGGGASGGGKPQQNANRAFESNGPDNLKIRGHAQHVYEKYQQLARDAMSAGDRVLGENFLQHAEHYFRLIRTLQPNRPYTDIVSREGFASGYDIDFEDEGGEGSGEDQDASAETGDGTSSEGDYRDQQPRQDRWETRGGETRADQPRQDYNRQDRNGQDRNNQDRNGQDRNAQDQGRQDRGGYSNNRGANGNRDRNYDRNRNEGRWENRNAEGQGDRNDAPRSDNARSDNARSEAQPAEDRRPERQDRDAYSRRERGAYGERDPLPVVEPQAAPLTETPAPQAEAVADYAEKRAPRVLRSRDGDESHTPAFLQAAAAPVLAATEEAPAKRPRGRPKKVAEAASPETEEA